MFQHEWNIGLNRLKFGKHALLPSSTTFLAPTFFFFFHSTESFHVVSLKKFSIFARLLIGSKPVILKSVERLTLSLLNTHFGIQVKKEQT